MSGERAPSVLIVQRVEPTGAWNLRIKDARSHCGLLSISYYDKFPGELFGYVLNWTLDEETFSMKCTISHVDERAEALAAQILGPIHFQAKAALVQELADEVQA